jgi:hypothetical protein
MSQVNPQPTKEEWSRGELGIPYLSEFSRTVPRRPSFREYVTPEALGFREDTEADIHF